MAIPKYNEFMLPMLKILADGQEHKAKNLKEILADEFQLSTDDRSIKVPSGKTLLYKSRVGWAASYLLQANLINSQKRGVYSITQTGRQLLNQRPDIIDIELLMRYPSFVNFRNRSRSSVNRSNEQISIGDEQTDQTPDIIIDEAYKQIVQALSDDLLLEIMNQSPAFFEQLVVDLLLAMGYGGSSIDMAQVVGRSGDEGIDGVIKEDKLGFNSIYIQAKRWDVEKAIDRSEIQKFVGALAGQGATKGLFITTASFSKSAIDYANKQHSVKVVLVDGRMLATLMIEHNLGVSTKTRYEIKTIDSDFFNSDE